MPSPIVVSEAEVVTTFKNLESEHLRKVLPLLLYFLLARSRVWPSAQKALPKVIGDFLASLETLMGKREVVQNTRVRSDAEIFSLLGNPFSFLLGQEPCGSVQEELLGLCSSSTLDPRNCEVSRKTIVEWLNAGHLLFEQRLAGEARRDQVRRAELENQVGERDRVIQELQTELYDKVGQRDQIIHQLQAELHGKVGERDRIIRDLQAELYEIRRTRMWRLMSFWDAFCQKLGLHRSKGHREWQAPG